MKGDNLLVMPQNDDRTVEGVMERLTVRIDLSEKFVGVSTSFTSTITGDAERCRGQDN